MRRSLIAVGALAAAAFLTPRANAGVLSIAVWDGTTSVALACAGGVNSTILCTGADANFSSIAVSGQGAGVLLPGNLSSITIDATSAAGGTHVLDVRVFQDLLAAGGAPVTGASSATSTFTINHLVGGPFGPTTESTFVNGTGLGTQANSTPLGTVLATDTFPATATNATASFTDPLPASLTADAHRYLITFTGVDQSATDSIQLVVNTPEPATVALLGTGLLGLAGMITLRRRR
jgi:hypothetical protein